MPVKKPAQDSEKDSSKKAKEESLQKRVSADIEAGLLYQTEDKWLETSRKINQMIEGKKSGGPYCVNTFFNLRNLLVPSLYYDDPAISIQTDKEECVKVVHGQRVVVNAGQAAQLRQDIINAAFKKFKIGREFQKAISDASVYAWGALKTGISSKTDPDTEAVSEKAIFVSAICPEDVIYDPMGTGSFDNCAFVAHRMVKEVDEIDSDLRKEKGIKGQDLDDESVKGKLYKIIADATKRKYITIFEFHDQKKKKIYKVARDSDKNSKGTDHKDVILETKDQSTKHGRSHFTLLRFDSVNDKIRGVGFLATQMDLTRAVNRVFSLSIKHVEMFGGLMVYEKGSLSRDQLAKWEDQKSGDMLEVEPNALVNGRFRREGPLSMGADYFASITMFHQLIDRELGIPDFQGLRNTKRKSATESSFEQSDASTRRNYFLGFVKDALLDVADKVLALVKEHYSRKEVESLIGRDVDPLLWDVELDESIFSADLDIMDMVSYNQSMAMGLMQGLAALLANPLTAQACISQLDGAKIGKKVFKGFGASWNAFARDPDSPHAENNPYEENQWAEQGQILQDPSPLEDHQKHFQIHSMKVMELQIVGKPAEAQELNRHVQVHQQMQTILNPQPQGQPGQMNGGQGGNVPMNNPNSPAQPESQPEMTGNFVDNGQGG